jgi:hypothetical protein
VQRVAEARLARAMVDVKRKIAETLLSVAARRSVA